MSAGSIVAVRLGAYRFPFREPWPTAEGPQVHREGILLSLEDGEGRVGVGESAPFPGFGLETLESSRSALRLAARFAVGLPPEHFLAAADDLPRLAPVAASPCARAALDSALHDLAAQREGRTVASLLGGRDARGHVFASAVIPRLSPQRTAEAAREAVALGARCVKIKVGGTPLAADVERLRAAREAVGENVALRVDANQSWSETEALEALRAFSPFRLEYVEQPIPAGAIEALARLRTAAGVPIAADEALTDLRAARRLIAARAADVFIVKPMVLGGMAAARAIIGVARDAGIRTVVTTLLESAAGRSAALHLAASLGDDADHGVATGNALVSDLLSGVADRPGRVALPDGPGLGGSLRAAVIARTEALAVEVAE